MTPAHADSVPPLIRLWRWLLAGTLRAALAGYLFLTWLLGKLRRRGEVHDGPYRVLLTGTFESLNWVSAHVVPMAMADCCEHIDVVSTVPVPELANVRWIQPPALLSRIVGDVSARLLMFLWVGLRTHPDIVGGFHLLFNGLAAQLLSAMIGARSLYFSVGGPAEVLGGGIGSENRIFRKLGMPNPAIERQLLQVVNAMDLVIVMGHSASRFYQDRCTEPAIHVISGGIDGTRFYPADEPKSIDILLVARLSPIKRVERFIRAVHYTRTALQRELNAVIVGDGPERTRLEAIAAELSLKDTLSFVGKRPDIEQWLRRSRVFLLTSESEGLPLAVMEAMLCGLPVVASNVGDLPDLVIDGENGFLVGNQDGDEFGERVTRLLEQADLLATFSGRARSAASRFERGYCVAQWNCVLSNRVDIPAVAEETAK